MLLLWIAIALQKAGAVQNMQHVDRRAESLFKAHRTRCTTVMAVQKSDKYREKSFV